MTASLSFSANSHLVLCWQCGLSWVWKHPCTFCAAPKLLLASPTLRQAANTWASRQICVEVCLFFVIYWEAAIVLIPAHFGTARGTGSQQPGDEVPFGEWACVSPLTGQGTSGMFVPSVSSLKATWPPLKCSFPLNLERIFGWFCVLRGWRYGTRHLVFAVKAEHNSCAVRHCQIYASI